MVWTASQHTAGACLRWFAGRTQQSRHSHLENEHEVVDGLAAAEDEGGVRRVLDAPLHHDVLLDEALQHRLRDEFRLERRHACTKSKQNVNKLTESVTTSLQTRLDSLFLHQKFHISFGLERL